MTGKRVKRSSYGTWWRKGEEIVLKEAGTQDVRVYIDRIQVMVVQWVYLWPIFEIYAQQETGYEGRGWRQPPWWQQMAADVQLRVALEDIFPEAKERRRR